jgi:flavin-dependent dehydrogenase
MAPSASWDVVVVGGRCAGAPLAMLLARRGMRVLLVDRDQFPSDTISSHGLFQTSHAHLERWGLWEDYLATGPELVEDIEFVMDDIRIRGQYDSVAGHHRGSAPRRFIVDQMLIEAAAASGAEVRTGTSLINLLREDHADGQRVSGVVLRSSGSGEVSERSRLVVGADGKFSSVAKAVGADKYRDDGRRTIQYYSYWSGTQLDRMRFFVQPDWGLATGPTHHGLQLMSLGTNPKMLPEFRVDIDATFMRLVQSVEELADLVEGGQREEPFRGLAAVDNYRRQSFGPGWALAGDAAYLRDPVTQQGMTDAFSDAERLSCAIEAGLAQGGDLTSQLAAAQDDRDRATESAYEWTLSSTKFKSDNEDTQRLLTFVAQDQELSNMFVNLNPGLVTMKQLRERALAKMA